MLDEYLHSADWFDAMLFDATDAILKGYSCMEIEHGMLGKMHIIRAIRWRDSGHFCLNPDDLSELRLRDGSHAGVAFQPFGWIVHQSVHALATVVRRGLSERLSGRSFSKTIPCAIWLNFWRCTACR